MFKNSLARDPEKIHFSIIIPTFNEALYISKCLRSILNQEYPIDQFEVIVVDNGSTDQTCQIVDELLTAYLHKFPDVNVGAVRNFGASKAIGNVLVFIDGDCVLDKFWLMRAQKLIERHADSVFGGAAKLPDNPKWIERYWLLEKNGLPTLPRRLIGATIVIPRALFEAVEGFDEKVTANEDTKLHQNLELANIPVNITHDLDVIHLGNAKTVKAFLRRQMWQAENYRKSFQSAIKDKIFWVTLIYGFSLIIGISSLFSTAIDAILGLLITQIPPALLTVKRLTQAKLFPSKIQAYIYCLAIDNIYLLGRLAGLVTSPARHR